MLTEGMYIAERYEIVGKIGTGGMSDVYKAKDHILGRYVAIKVLKQEFSEDVNFVTKFRTEAQSAGGLEHPNIVNIYDVGSEDGMYYIVMEYVEGITLKTYIEKKGQLSYKEAVSIAIQVGRGIEAAHNKHIVHRDIKPQNVIISTEGKVKVTDFGIARAANTNTIHSDVMGSVHYTSPEQARNGFVDGKSDIYSLGIVMYEMVTGRVPFDGDTTVAIAIQHLQEEMTPPSAFAPNLPISMEKIIAKCTQKSPDRRYESISDLLVDLKKVLISPNEDFVTLIPIGQENKTRVIQQEEVDTIKKETSKIYYTEEPEEEDEDEEEEDDGGFLNPKMEKAVTIAGIVAAVIIVVIILCILGSVTGLFKFGGGSGKDKDKDTPISESEQPPTEEEDDKQEEPQEEEETVIMISLIGKTPAEANEALNKMGLGCKEVANAPSDQYEAGKIIDQNRKEGEAVPLHETIEVTVSSGAGEFDLVSVVGEDEDTAKRTLENMGLSAVTDDFVYDDSVPEGKVISQSPESGNKVKKGDTVRLIVSRGQESRMVPDVTNLSEADARARLEQEGFTVTDVTTEYHDTIAEGCVIRQSPNGGEYRSKGAAVSLVLSMGKQAVYYSYSGTFAKPKDSQGSTVEEVVVSAELTNGDGTVSIPVEIDDQGGSIVISASNIQNVSSGLLNIYWEWTEPEIIDEETGDIIEAERNETDTTGPLNVSFQQQ